MDNQIILVCDEKGKFNGEYIPKEVGHTGEGKRHLAIAVLLENSKGEVLLQRRKHKIFNDIWDVTGATHPLHLKNGIDETYEEATERCLKREYGIGVREVREVRVVGEFNYFSQYGELCENEHCAMLIGKYDGQLNLNPEVGYNYKWMDKKEFLKDIKQNPTHYSPWAVEGVKLLICF
ncbi:MAG: NUDIX domain-containing protein [Candidatus Daviesbacteria bacterium]|nr:NUDIX domain-containing protein [Candidatus Daviesbacteria bacterium]